MIYVAVSSSGNPSGRPNADNTSMQAQGNITIQVTTTIFNSAQRNMRKIALRSRTKGPYFFYCSMVVEL